MSGALKVTVAGMDFFGQGMHDFVIEPEGFDGWDDGVDMRLEKTVRPQAHGSFDLPGFQDSRTVAISGHAFADSNKQLRWLRGRVTGLLADGGSGRVQVDRDGDVQWADCRLASKTKFTELGGNDIASFQIQLWCADARKFGEFTSVPIGTASPAALRHRGNYDASPLVRVDGPVVGAYTVTGPAGEQYTVTGGIASGSQHVIDFNDGLLRVNGVITAALVTTAGLWKVPPGQKVTATISNGAGHIELLDTYI